MAYMQLLVSCFRNRKILFCENKSDSTLYISLYLEIDSEGQLRTKLYVNIDGFKFRFVNFSFICSNIPAAPA